MKRNLTKKDKIKTKRDISKIFSSSSFQVGCRGVRLRYLKNNLPYNRLMICLVSKFGNAIKRNKAKRVFREIYRNNQELIEPGYDLAFILLPGDYETKERKKQFKTLINRAELFSKSK